MGSLKFGLTLPVFSSGVEESVVARKRIAATSNGAQLIGERLAAFRKARGITQVEMAARLHSTQGLVSKYERGELLIHGELIAQLASILDVSADDVLGVERKRKVRVAVPAPTVDRGLARRFAQVQSLPRRDRDALLRTLDAFLALRLARSSGRRAA